MTRKVTVQGEIRSGRAEFADRLRRLGADDVQVAAFDDRWAELGAGVRTMSDDNLRAILAEMTGFDDSAVPAEPEPVEPDGGYNPIDADGTDRGDDPALGEARRAHEAEGVAESSIPVTTDWIGTDVARAQVVLDHERARGDEARKGMLEAAEAVLQAATPGQ